MLDLIRTAPNYRAKLALAIAEFEGLALRPIDIQRSQIMAAARWTKPVKCAVR